MHVTWTRREIVFLALEELGIIAAGQTPAEEDVAVVDKLFDGAVDELNSRKVVYIDDPGTLGPDGGAIDGDVAPSVASWLANAAAVRFGGQFDATKKEFMENTIRQIRYAEPTYEPMQAEYF